MICLLFGRRGSGKTFLMQLLAEKAAQNSLVLVHDPVFNFQQGEHTTLENFRNRSEIPTHGLFIFRDCEPGDVAEIAATIRDCVVCFDEIDLLCTATHWKSQWGREIALRGRHYNVAVFATGQRFVNCHADLLALATKIASFRQEWPADITRIGHVMGDAYVDAVQNLGVGECVVYPDAVIAKAGDRPQQMKLPGATEVAPGFFAKN